MADGGSDVREWRGRMNGYTEGCSSEESGGSGVVKVPR